MISALQNSVACTCGHWATVCIQVGNLNNQTVLISLVPLTVLSKRRLCWIPLYIEIMLCRYCAQIISVISLTGIPGRRTHWLSVPIKIGHAVILTVGIIFSMLPIVPVARNRLHIEVIVVIINRSTIVINCAYYCSISSTAHHGNPIVTKIGDLHRAISILIRNTTIVIIPFDRIFLGVKVEFLNNSSLCISSSLHRGITHVNRICDHTFGIHIACACHIAIYRF